MQEQPLVDGDVRIERPMRPGVREFIDHVGMIGKPVQEHRLQLLQAFPADPRLDVHDADTRDVIEGEGVAHSSSRSRIRLRMSAARLAISAKESLSVISRTASSRRP